MMKPPHLALTALFLLMPGPLSAEPAAQVVTQKDKRFSVKVLTVHQGAAVTFRNDDSMRHNVAVVTPDGEERTGIVQEPGTSTSMTFDRPGRFQLHCLIHPQMRMVVDVDK